MNDHFCVASPSPTSATADPNTKTAWFNEARFGMFIHWGAYSVAARGEWVMNRERIPLEEYQRLYVDRFTAERFDPDAWVKLAKDAGMKYMVLTARHLDGFALWNTATRDFNSVKMGPKRDLVREYVEAVRRGGLKVGLYYCVADLTHPDYPTPFARSWPEGWADEAARQRFVAYYREQLRELMSNYGRIDMLWYDGCIPKPTDGAETNAMVRRLQPHILTNSRNEEPDDFTNSEQAICPPTNPERHWEACMTLNDDWGYHAGDENWKTAPQVARMLVETARGGGNLLLNVGPRGVGTIPEPSAQILRRVGDWLARNREFLPHSDRSPFGWINWGAVSTRGRQVYLHVFYPVGPTLCFAELRNRVLQVHMVNGNRPLRFEQRDKRLFIYDLPEKCGELALVIRLDVEGKLTPLIPETCSWIPGVEP